MSAPSEVVSNFLNNLNGVRRSGENWIARCPCRDDDNSPSLSIAEGRDGRVLVKCHRGGAACDLNEICDAMGLEQRDLHPQETSSGKGDYKEGELTNVYSYYETDGELSFQVLRFAMPDGRKEFRQRVPDTSGEKKWKYSTAHLETKPLYRLPQITKAVQNDQIIFVVEGEKDVENLVERGLEATCNPQGADNGNGSKWKPNHTAALAGARVVIIQDNDDPGWVHADYVASQLVRHGSTVKIKRCPDGYKDISDFLEDGGSVSELIEVEIREPDPFVMAVDEIVQISQWDVPLGVKLAKAQSLLTETTPLEVPRTGRLINWGEFISETMADPYDWLIDGLLERQERVVIVAAEGVGKTTLARQVAICAGSGIHPFTYMEIPPVRTLFVDLENPERIIRRQARKIIESISLHYGKRPAQASLFTKPDGLNILKMEDRALLERQIVETETELLVLGPIYKSYIDPGNKTSTALVSEVCTYFDYLRANYGITLWLEHHAPLGNSLSGREMRPADSAVWQRWPEFGYGITRDATSVEREYDWKGFREPRDERYFPQRMKRGTIFPFEVISFRDHES